MTSSSIPTPTGAAVRRLLREQRLKAKQLLLNVQQLELSVRFFMSAQDDLNAAVEEIVSAAQEAAELLRQKAAGDAAAEAAASRLHEAAAALHGAAQSDPSAGGGTQPSTVPSDGGGTTPPDVNFGDSPEPDTNPDSTPASVDPTQL